MRAKQGIAPSFLTNDIKLGLFVNVIGQYERLKGQKRLGGPLNEHEKPVVDEFSGVTADLGFWNGQNGPTMLQIYPMLH